MNLSQTRPLRRLICAAVAALACSVVACTAPGGTKAGGASERVLLHIATVNSDLQSHPADQLPREKSEPAVRRERAHRCDPLCRVRRARRGAAGRARRGRRRLRPRVRRHPDLRHARRAKLPGAHRADADRQLPAAAGRHRQRHPAPDDDGPGPSAGHRPGRPGRRAARAHRGRPPVAGPAGLVRDHLRDLQVGLPGAGDPRPRGPGEQSFRRSARRGAAQREGPGLREEPAHLPAQADADHGPLRDGQPQPVAADTRRDRQPRPARQAHPAAARVAPAGGRRRRGPLHRHVHHTSKPAPRGDPVRVRRAVRQRIPRGHRRAAHGVRPRVRQLGTRPANQDIHRADPAAQAADTARPRARHPVRVHRPRPHGSPVGPESELQLHRTRRGCRCRARGIVGGQLHPR